MPTKQPSAPPFFFFCTHAGPRVILSVAALIFSLALRTVQTVGSLDAVNAQVGREGLQKRVVLPRLVVETADESMPPKRRVVGGASHALAKHRPKGSAKKEDGGKGGGGGVAHRIEKPQVV